MQGINLKPSSGVSAAASTAKPAMSNSVWKSKLEAMEAKPADASAVQPATKVAKLLQKAGMLGREQYCDAQEIADSLNKSIDQVLLTSFLSEKQSTLCASAISFLERGVIGETLAVEALAFANVRTISFEESLRYHGFGW
jgi:hypothetical protein